MKKFFIIILLFIFNFSFVNASENKLLLIPAVKTNDKDFLITDFHIDFFKKPFYEGKLDFLSFYFKIKQNLNSEIFLISNFSENKNVEIIQKGEYSLKNENLEKVGFEEGNIINYKNFPDEIEENIGKNYFFKNFLVSNLSLKNEKSKTGNIEGFNGVSIKNSGKNSINSIKIDTRFIKKYFKSEKSNFKFSFGGINFFSQETFNNFENNLPKVYYFTEKNEKIKINSYFFSGIYDYENFSKIKEKNYLFCENEYKECNLILTQEILKSTEKIEINY